MPRGSLSGGASSMDESIWRPRVTVAALAERDGQFLLVRENVRGQIVFNQPAGHLEAEESLIDAVIRETLEETRYRFNPDGLVSIYRFTPDDAPHKTYLRFLFRGTVDKQDELPLDEGILGCEWMTLDEVLACQHQHRTPVVLQGIRDYLEKPPYSLDILSTIYP